MSFYLASSLFTLTLVQVGMFFVIRIQQKEIRDLNHMLDQVMNQMAVDYMKKKVAE